MVTGLIIEQTDGMVVLQAPQAEPIQLSRNEIDELAADTVSMMPESLLQNLTAQQQPILLEFLYQQRTQSQNRRSPFTSENRA